jgi:predicted dehydrogenase
MNKNLILIGAGQLGSRHLQGLLKLKGKNTIYVIDPSLDSLDIAKKRANEFVHQHIIHFKDNWKDLPDFFDLAIIATNANVREKVVMQLLCGYQIKNLILEKVLFQEIETFEKIATLLEKKNVRTWVNHARRSYKSYCNIKKQLNSEIPKVYQITGGNWGLGCNGLHFIDLILYLSGSKISTLDSEWIDKQIIENKRKGFIEFTGTIKGQLENGSSFFITSLKNESSAITITIFDSTSRYIIQEGGTPQTLILKGENNFQPESFPFIVEFQSNLTTQLVEDILLTGECNLPSFAEACEAHKPFIKCLLNNYKTITGIETKILPIT